MGILANIKKALAGSSPAAKPPQRAPLKELPPSFYFDAVELHRADKNRFLRSNPNSPITDRANFTGLNYYPVNPAFRFVLRLNRATKPEPLTLPTSSGDERPLWRIGVVSFEIDGQTAQLAVYQGEADDGLFVPFRDATSGVETYGAGRYLEPEEAGPDEIVLDFNLAYNPFCAYANHYSCPLPPAENHLAVAIRAGEKDYP